MINPEAVIFDFDFTLADSSKAIVECVGCALEQLGFEVPRSEQIFDTIGLSLPETFRRLTVAADSSMEARFVQYFHHHADQIMDGATLMYDCVPGVLETLRGANVRTGIVSTKLNYRISNILQRNGLDHLFDVIVGADNVANTKPDPEGLLLALNKLAVSSAAALYIGDHVLDAEAARAAGMAFIAVLSGRHSRKQFEDAGCAGIMENVGELVGVLGLVAQKR
jgi:phosphoglycolate phosphatase